MSHAPTTHIVDLFERGKHQEIQETLSFDDDVTLGDQIVLARSIMLLGQYTDALDFYGKQLDLSITNPTTVELGLVAGFLELINHYDTNHKYTQYFKRVQPSISWGLDDNQSVYQYYQAIIQRELGHNSQKTGDLRASLQQLEKAQSSFKILHRPFDEIICFIELAETHALFGKISTAMDMVHQGMMIEKRLRNNYAKLCLDLKEGIILGRSGNISKAHDVFLKTEKSLRKTQYYKEIAAINNSLSITYNRQTKFNKALFHGDLTRQTAFDYGFANLEALALQNLGNVFYFQGKLGKALDSYIKSLEYFSLQENQRNQAGLYQNIALTMDRQGDSHQALELLYKAENIQIELAMEGELARVTFNIGEIHSRLGNLVIGEKYLRQALKLSKEVTNGYLEAKSRGQLATIAILRGSFTEATTHLTAAISLYQESRNELELAKALIDISMLDRYTNNLSTSEGHLLKAENLIVKIGDQLTHADILLKLAELAFELDKIDDIRKYKNQINKLAKNVNNKHLDARAQLVEILYLSKMGDLESWVEIKKILDKLVNQEIEDFDLYASTILYLCQYLILEYKSTNREVTLELVLVYLDELFVVSTKQGNTILVIEILTLQVKIALIEKNYTVAKFLVNEALEVANTAEIDFLKIKLSNLKIEVDHVIQPILSPQSTSKQRGPERSTEIDEVLNDINNYLLSVAGFSELFYSEINSSEEIRTVVGSLEVSSKAIQKQISGILKRAQISEAKVTSRILVPTESIDIVAVIKQREKLYASQFRLKSITLDYVNLDRPQFHRTDEDRLVRILDRLLFDMLKYSPNDGRIQVLMNTDEVDFVNIEFQVEGKALPKTDLDKLEDHSQIKDSFIDRMYALVKCQELMRQMNGDLAVISPITGENYGMQIILKLPNET